MFRQPGTSFSRGTTDASSSSLWAPVSDPAIGNSVLLCGVWGGSAGRVGARWKLVCRTSTYQGDVVWCTALCGPIPACEDGPGDAVRDSPLLPANDFDYVPEAIFSQTPTLH